MERRGDLLEDGVLRVPIMRKKQVFHSASGSYQSAGYAVTSWVNLSGEISGDMSRRLSVPAFLSICLLKTIHHIPADQPSLPL